MDRKKISMVISILKTLHVADFESMDKVVSLVYLLEDERRKINEIEEKHDG